MTEHRWQGSALLRPGVLAFTGTIGATDRHAHHAVQIITAPTELTVIDGTGVRHRSTKVIVPANAAHRIETGALRGSLVFLDPESTPGRAAHQRSVHIGWTPGPVLAHTRERPLAAVVADLLKQLTPVPAAEVPERHPAVLAALLLLPDLVEHGGVRGTEVAARVGVSTSRLTHLFTDQVGIPLRRYVLWLRLQIAINRVQARRRPDRRRTRRRLRRQRPPDPYLSRHVRASAIAAEPARVLGHRRQRLAETFKPRPAERTHH